MARKERSCAPVEDEQGYDAACVLMNLSVRDAGKCGDAASSSLSMIDGPDGSAEIIGRRVKRRNGGLLMNSIKSNQIKSRKGS